MSYTEENISNFDECCKFFERTLTNEELYKFLRSGSISERGSLPVLKLRPVRSRRRLKF